MRIQIATGNSRMEKRWNNVEMELDEFIERISLLFGELSAPRFFTLNAPVFRMVWINIQNS